MTHTTLDQLETKLLWILREAETFDDFYHYIWELVGEEE